jgi:hypothetical protein
MFWQTQGTTEMPLTGAEKQRAYMGRLRARMLDTICRDAWADAMFHLPLRKRRGLDAETLQRLEIAVRRAVEAEAKRLAADERGLPPHLRDTTAENVGTVFAIVGVKRPSSRKG